MANTKVWEIKPDSNYGHGAGLVQIQNYEKGVDPVTGMPIVAGNRVDSFSLSYAGYREERGAWSRVSYTTI